MRKMSHILTSWEYWDIVAIFLPRLEANRPGMNVTSCVRRTKDIFPQTTQKMILVSCFVLQDSTICGTKFHVQPMLLDSCTGNLRFVNLLLHYNQPLFLLSCC
jgi:hypothetical protein